jgi:hypothetical protein
MLLFVGRRSSPFLPSPQRAAATVLRERKRGEKRMDRARGTKDPRKKTIRVRLSMPTRSG